MADMDLEAQYIKSLTKLTVTMTLESMGLIKDYMSTRECEKLYGKWFKDHVQDGSLRCVVRCNRKEYSKVDIEALQAAEMKRAKLQLATIK